MSSFFRILNHHKQRVLWNDCWLLISHYFGWSFQHFSYELLISFLIIFKLNYIIFTSNDNLIFAEISVLLLFRPKRSQIRAFCMFFRKFCHFIFLKKVWKENYCDTWLPIPNSMSDKILRLELLPKIIFLLIFWEKGPKGVFCIFCLENFFIVFSWK